MNKKLLFLTKISLNKKIKTKWFLIANTFFLILIIGLINIDSIIKLFGGDFNEAIDIIVIDEIGKFDSFKNNFESSSKALDDYVKVNITKTDKSYEEATKELKKDDNLIVVLSPDKENLIASSITSEESIGSITKTLINSSINSIHTELALKKYNISYEKYAEINTMIEPEIIVLSENNNDDDLTISSIMQIITLPLFMLIIFLVQMIGAEVNEEKTTKSMEIIISNVSPKTHFLSKVISSNLFVIIQGSLLLLFGGLGLLIRYFITGGNIFGSIGTELSGITSLINLKSITATLSYVIPILLVMILLTFFAYSLLAGILASMTTNLEDYQQMQTPIVIISLVGYYLSIMVSMFKGSIFIKIMSYIPFISAILAPTLYVLGEVTIIDLFISVLALIGTIYLLIKYGLRIYKVGILNYSGVNLWKKMLGALKDGKNTRN